MSSYRMVLIMSNDHRVNIQECQISSAQQTIATNGWMLWWQTLLFDKFEISWKIMAKICPPNLH